MNGLQVEGASDIKKIIGAVDINDAVIEYAISQKADTIIVHHGFFWGKPLAVEGVLRERIKKLLMHNINLYAVHLPLDMHPVLGNNIAIMNALGIHDTMPLADWGGFPMGVVGSFATPQPVEALKQALVARFGTLKHEHCTRDTISTVGVITGDAFSVMDDVLRSPIDLFISGEFTHAMYFPFVESGKSGLFLGHYASEKGGIQALCSHLIERYGNDIQVQFFEHDSGL